MSLSAPGFWPDHGRPCYGQDLSKPPMSDTPVTLDGSSGPLSDGFVAPSTPKKPWRAPLVITSTEAAVSDKIHLPIDINSTSFGPS